MAHLRAGQLDEAAQRFHESLKTAPSWDSRFLNWLGLTLVHYEHGKTEDTRQWLGKSVDLMNQRARPALQHRIEGQLLRREVEQLLGKSKQEKGDTESKQEAPVAESEPKDANAAESKLPSPEATSNAKPKEKQE